MSGHDDFEFEPVRGLPAHLPAGERLLWQGSPDFRSLAIRAFHARKAAGYFGFLITWRVVEMGMEGATAAEIVPGCLWLAFLGTLLVALLTLLAWLSARGAVYTITTRRVVLRHGIALPMTLNVPFSAVAGASLARHADGTGDVALRTVASQRVGYLLTWPHVRRWRFAQPEPMLRALRNPAEVAELLSDAWRAATPASEIAAATTEHDNARSRAGATHDVAGATA